MRELRLGKMPNANQTMIKQKICNNMTMVDSCMDNLLVEVTPLSNWVMPSTKTTCLDLQTKIVPVVQLNIGQQNQLMLVRACLVQDMIFPTTGLGMSLPKNYNGDFNLIAASAYVNEPN
jgi:hypothetical protein